MALSKAEGPRPTRNLASPMFSERDSSPSTERPSTDGLTDRNDMDENIFQQTAGIERRDSPHGGLHKCRDVPLQFVQRPALNINHMPGIELPGGNVAPQSRVKAEVSQGIIHRIERRGEIEVALRHEDLHVFVFD